MVFGFLQDACKRACLAHGFIIIRLFTRWKETGENRKALRERRSKFFQNLVSNAPAEMLHPPWPPSHWSGWSAFLSSKRNGCVSSNSYVLLQVFLLQHLKCHPNRVIVEPSVQQIVWNQCRWFRWFQKVQPKLDFGEFRQQWKIIDGRGKSLLRTKGLATCHKLIS